MCSTTPADSTRARGDRGEDAVVAHLQAQGWIILARNWRVRRGEIDIVAKTPNKILSILEVKTARYGSVMDPADWITPAKQQRLGKLAQLWCAQHQMMHVPVRLDAALVHQTLDGFQIEILENAFDLW